MYVHVYHLWISFLRDKQKFQIQLNALTMKKEHLGTFGFAAVAAFDDALQAEHLTFQHFF